MNSFFKNGLLVSFLIGMQLQNQFSLGLSFNNEEKWLSQLDWIPTNVCDNNWQEAEIEVQTKVDGQKLSIGGVQYGNIIYSTKFLLGYLLFASDLVYGPIRQYNNENKRVYTKFQTGD